MSLLRYGVKYIQKVYSLKKRKQQITMLAYNAKKMYHTKQKNNTKYNKNKKRNTTCFVIIVKKQFDIIQC